MHTYKWAKTYIQNRFGPLKVIIFDFEPTALKNLYVFTTSDIIIKEIYKQQYLEECGHLQKVAELLKRYEGKDWLCLFPCGGDFPEPLKFEGNIDYVRAVLEKTIVVTKDREGYVLSCDLSPKSDFKTYNKQVNGGKSNDACHEVIEKRIKACGEDYRFETEPHPIEELSNRKLDNTSIAR